MYARLLGDWIKHICCSKRPATESTPSATAHQRNESRISGHRLSPQRAGAGGDDGSGHVESILVLKLSTPEFRPVADGIIEMMRCTKAPKGMKGYKTETVNRFRIPVTTGSSIQIDQFSGE